MVSPCQTDCATLSASIRRTSACGWRGRVGSRALSDGPEPATESRSRVSAERGSIESQSEDDMEHSLEADRRARGHRARGGDRLWIGLYVLRLRRGIRMRDDPRDKLGPVFPGPSCAFALGLELRLVLDLRLSPPLTRHRGRARLAVQTPGVACPTEQQLATAAKATSWAQKHGGRPSRQPRTGPPTTGVRCMPRGVRGVRTSARSPRAVATVKATADRETPMMRAGRVGRAAPPARPPTPAAGEGPRRSAPAPRRPGAARATPTALPLNVATRRTGPARRAESHRRRTAAFPAAISAFSSRGPAVQTPPFRLAATPFHCRWVTSARSVT